MRICIIGGIGSGKSEVLKVAREMGVTCLSADEINAQLLCTPDYVGLIAKEFPFAVKDGKVDKPSLSAAVFSDNGARERLNAIAHPAIMRRINGESANPLVVELPLVLESGAADTFDEIVFVDAPLLTRIKRLKGRGLSTRRALSIIRTQAHRRDLKKIATRVIDNSQSLKRLRADAAKLLRALLSEN